ncbi:zinc ribbon domain-containing protein YjdM [Azorhizobium sp. AG788]|uniref:zinc ribbon domain-containing protein YjdM n=1 Tax=Azorhizobium sp. AG788 TaxID=2183897 RepID=UPI00313A05B3
MPCQFPWNAPQFPECDAAYGGVAASCPYNSTTRPWGRGNKGTDVSDEIIVKDSNGAKLADGDSVTLIKDLKVKGTSETLKRGTLVKNIRLTGDPAEVECNTKQVKGLVLRTEFLKKA